MILNQLQSPLLRLPAELRNNIFAFALDTADLQPRYSRGDVTLQIVNLGRCLSQTCTQIRKETEHLHDSFTRLRFLYGSPSRELIFDVMTEHQRSRILSLQLSTLPCTIIILMAKVRHQANISGLFPNVTYVHTEYRALLWRKKEFIDGLKDSFPGATIFTFSK